MKKKSNSFWNNRALNNKVPGSNDPFLDYFETKKIISLLPKNKKINILDVGCGSGELLQNVKKVKKVDIAFGIDFSKEMILKANKNNKHKKIKYLTLDMNNINELKEITNIKFDFIITKRSIINVLSRSKQLKVINDLGYFLKKKGKILSCECSRDDQKNINKVRLNFGLKEINPPWHNLYFSDLVLKKYKFKNVKLKHIHNFSSAFYFVSRVINALEKKITSKPAKYNDVINKIGWMINPEIIKGYSQTKIYEFIKRI